MLAPAIIPGAFWNWNRSQKAPDGPEPWHRIRSSQRPLARWIRRRRTAIPGIALRWIGPFGFQENSPTRSYEYPWCFHALPIVPRMSVVEIGAGLSGFQFVLSRAGAHVVSVDPLINPNPDVDWTFPEQDFRHLNRAFGTNVRFIRSTLQQAALPAASLDRAYCISAMEHIPVTEIPPLLDEIRRILRPGACLVLTVDLFLDCSPFTSKDHNQWGTNVPVAKLAEAVGFSLVQGNREEIYGYPEFRTDTVLSRISEFLCHRGVLSQCAVFQRC